MTELRRLDRLEASFPSGGLWERFGMEFKHIPHRHRMAMRRWLRGHPDRFPVREKTPEWRRDTENLLARLTPAEWREAALRLAEGFAAELAAHELAEPECPQCKAQPRYASEVNA